MAKPQPLASTFATPAEASSTSPLAASCAMASSPGALRSKLTVKFRISRRELIQAADVVPAAPGPALKANCGRPPATETMPPALATKPVPKDGLTEAVAVRVGVWLTAGCHMASSEK